MHGRGHSSSTTAPISKARSSRDCTTKTFTPCWSSPRHSASSSRRARRRPASSISFQQRGVHAWIQPRCSACWILRGNRLFVRDEVAALLASRAARVRRGRVARPTAQESITTRESVPPGSRCCRTPVGSTRHARAECRPARSVARARRMRPSDFSTRVISSHHCQL